MSDSLLLPTPQARVGITMSTRAVVGVPPTRPDTAPFVASYQELENKMMVRDRHALHAAALQHCGSCSFP